jgi:hypothetical protein
MKAEPKGNNKKIETQLWWCTLVIPALKKLRQEDQKYEASLGHIVSSTVASAT